MAKKILVIDDSALMRRVMCDIINSDSKFQATDYCRDGLEAYEKLKHTSYDGVVLDVNMPRMDGLQLLEKLQKEGIRANVVMVSTLTDSREADVTILAMERGAIDFVAKPTNIIEAKGEAFKRLKNEAYNFFPVPEIPEQKFYPVNVHFLYRWMFFCCNHLSRKIKSFIRIFICQSDHQKNILVLFYPLSGV